MPTLLGRNYQLNELKSLWAPVQEARLTLWGSTAILMSHADPDVGQPDATTFKSVGEEQLVHTWSKAPSTFDTPLDLTLASNYQGLIPFVTLDGVDEEWDTPDIAYLSRVTAPYSISFWIKPGDVASVVLLAKEILTGSSEDAEWELSIDSDGKLRLTMYDTSSATTNWTMFRPSTDSIVANVWTHVLVTINATQTAATDIKLYINGEESSGSGTKDASFTAMEAGAATLTFGFRVGVSANDQFYTGPIAGGPCGPMFAQVELSADAVRRDYQLTRKLLGV